MGISKSVIGKLTDKAATDRTVGRLGAKTIQAAYDQAAEKAGKAPTKAQIDAALTRAGSALANEKASTRINDGYIDSREAGLRATPVTEALYRYTETNKIFDTKNAANMQPGVKASLAQIEKAAASLAPVLASADALMAANPTKYDTYGDAVREAAIAAGLSKEARTCVMTAVAGAAEGERGSDPSAADVKVLLSRGAAKLKSADGAQIVDLANPELAAESKKDGIVTGLEVDRTPSVVGQTSRTLLRYASTL